MGASERLTEALHVSLRPHDLHDASVEPRMKSMTLRRASESHVQCEGRQSQSPATLIKAQRHRSDRNAQFNGAYGIAVRSPHPHPSGQPGIDSVSPTTGDLPLRRRFMNASIPSTNVHVHIIIIGRIGRGARKTHHSVMFLILWWWCRVGLRPPHLHFLASRSAHRSALSARQPRSQR